MKPIFSILKSERYLSVYYLEDSLLVGASYDECLNNVKATSKLLLDAGFIINYSKSSMTPSRLIKFLFFYLNSEELIVSLPAEKRENILTMCPSL